MERILCRIQRDEWISEQGKGYHCVVHKYMNQTMLDMKLLEGLSDMHRPQTLLQVPPLSDCTNASFLLALHWWDHICTAPMGTFHCIYNEGTKKLIPWFTFGISFKFGCNIPCALTSCSRHIFWNSQLLSLHRILDAYSSFQIYCRFSRTHKES